jgi:hypothetical protein
VRSIWRCSASGSSEWSSIASSHLAFVLEGGFLDLVLCEALLDGRDGSAELVDLLDQLPGTLLELARQRFDEIGAAERVGGVRPTCLVSQDLLCAERDTDGVLGR